MNVPAELFDLTGTVAVIAGGSRDIGRTGAEGFATAGADVVIASRKLDHCEAAAQVVVAAGRRSCPAAVTSGNERFATAWPRRSTTSSDDATYSSTNAGMSPVYDGLCSVTEDLYDKVPAVIARGPFRLSALIGTRIAEGYGGSIVNVTTAGTRLGPVGARDARQPRYTRCVRYRGAGLA
jgi:NAD(P)-dependent dehydrogenase (short-subunit alcohol dehydrogenase family)